MLGHVGGASARRGEQDARARGTREALAAGKEAKAAALARCLVTCATAARWEALAEADSGREEGLKEGDAAEEGEPETGGDVAHFLHAVALRLLGVNGDIAGEFDFEVDNPEDEEKRPGALASKLCIEEM